MIRTRKIIKNKFKNIKSKKKVKTLKIYYFKLIIFTILSILYKIIYSYKKFNNIHIGMSLNNEYIYPTMVSATSILVNSNKTTFIHFHLLHANNFTNQNKYKISSLNRVNQNCDFNFYNVRNNFTGWKSSVKNLKEPAFYRIIFGEIIPDIDKIIYLDGDTITYSDLNEMYNLNMTNLYFRGFREYVSRKFLKYVKVDRYICSGVMLMNLKLLRENNALQKFKDFYYFLTSKSLYYHDQHIINTIFTDKIGFLPPKYGIFHMSPIFMKNYLKSDPPPIYNISELIEANKNPVIRHNFGRLPVKPWLYKDYDETKTEWNYYAKKTGYYSSICQFFKNACINLNQNKTK